MRSKTEFWCETCGVQKKSFTQAEVVEHLKTFHGLAELKGERRGVSFMDGEKMFQNTYEWKIGPVKLTQVTSGTRRSMLGG